jgi:hypothetical protein
MKTIHPHRHPLPHESNLRMTMKDEDEKDLIYEK